MKQIMCVLLSQWPIDRQRRQLRRSGLQLREKEEVGSRQTSASSARLSSPKSVEPYAVGREAQSKIQNPKSTITPNPQSAIRNPQSKIANRKSQIPLVLLRTVAQRQLVMAASPEARAKGIRPGMTLAQAKALYTAVQYADHRPEQDRKSLEALGRWMMRYSPIVAIESGKPGEDDEWEGRPHHLFIDVTGCEKLFRGLDNLMNQVKQSLQRMNVAARVAIAPTPGAAWAMAYAGTEEIRPQINADYRRLEEESVCHCRPDSASRDERDSADALTKRQWHLPLESLRISPDLAESLHRLGLETISDVLKLPRESLPARFGPTLLRRIDQLTGDLAEPLIPLDDPRPLREAIDFEHVVPTLEPIWGVMEKMLARLMRELERRNCGARRVELHLKRSLTPMVSKTIFLSRPSRDVEKVMRLARCAIDGEFRIADFGLRIKPLKIRNPQSKIQNLVWSDNDGFTALRISVPLYERMDPEQIALMEGDEFAGRIELDDLVERLRVRLGDQSVGQPELRESHIPEKQADLALADPDASPQSKIQNPKSKISTQSKIENRKSKIPPHRPLNLLAAPVELRVMVSPSEDREGRPIAFTHAGHHHRVIHFVGPERIAGQWWEGHSKTRDYFDVEDEQGKRWWMFRVLQTAKWYLQGEFE